ncbi:glycosyltransferase family 4 protein [uncultured Thiodictyon sp.]|uniref:glycosyltransferase family 4 protein n=1 Tax=uncultured Thiodictyon sp. TaxID=1846217 RepID=UPI0025F31866|nr:glycosyltransferase family 4 protein [uncultured Thiodictyon sp.]
MHVVIICPSFGGVGAVSNVALHHAIELAKRFQVTVLSDSFPADEIAGVACVALRPARFGMLRRFAHVPNEIAFALTARAAVARLHQRDPVGFVIGHGHLVVATVAARRLLPALGIRVALVTHGDIFDRPAGTYDPRLTWLYRTVTRPAYRGADLVVALSPHMAGRAIAGGAVRERVVCIPNGIDPQDIGGGGVRRAPTAAVSDCLELLYVGRLSVEKGVSTLIAAAAILRARGLSIRLRVVGAGPTADVLRAQVSQLQLNDVVQFIGGVPRLALGEIYQSADIVCVPSVSDPLPTVVLEAMAAGVAVVGSDVGGIPFMVEDGVTGLIFKANDPVAQADALQRFAGDAGLARQMGEAGQRRVALQFNWPAIGQLLARALDASRPLPGITG